MLAKMAESLEDSDHTSGQDRLIAEQARRRFREYNRRKRLGESLSPRQEALLTKAREACQFPGFIEQSRLSIGSILRVDLSRTCRLDWPPGPGGQTRRYSGAYRANPRKPGNQHAALGQDRGKVRQPFLSLGGPRQGHGQSGSRQRSQVVPRSWRLSRVLHAHVASRLIKA